MNLYKNLIEHCGFKPPHNIEEHLSAALGDLYCGPHGADHWRDHFNDPDAEDYSFRDSCAIVGSWFDEQDWPRFCDEEGYPMGIKDCNQYDMDGVPYYEVDLGDLRREMFGELSRYL